MPSGQHSAFGSPFLIGLGLPFSEFFFAEGSSPVGQWLVLAAFAGLVALHWRQELLGAHFGQILLGLAGWYLICAAFSVRPLDSLRCGCTWILPMLAGYLMVLGGNERRARFSHLALGLVLGSLFLLGWHFFLSPGQGKAGIRPFFSDANVFSAFLNLLWPALLLGQREANWWWGARWLLVAVILLGLLYGNSRGAWVGLIGGGIAGLMVGQNTLRRRLRLGIGLVATGLIAFVLLRQYYTYRPQLPQPLPYVLSTADTQTDFSNRERLMRWTCAGRMWRAHPITGNGPGTFAPDFKQYLRDESEIKRISYWFGWKGGAHSVGLTALAETGLPGPLGLMALMLVALGGHAYIFRKKFLAETPPSRQKEKYVISLLAVIALSTWIVHGLFDDLLYRPPIAALLGMWAAINAPPTAHPSGPPPLADPPD
ncbi:MAG: O-antigen ligase family protein [Bacteroidota bacterium]